LDAENILINDDVQVDDDDADDDDDDEDEDDNADDRRADDTRSTDCLSTSKGHYPTTSGNENESLNSSGSSLLQQQYSAPRIFKNSILNRRLSGTSPPVQNPIYVRPTSNIDQLSSSLDMQSLSFASINNHTQSSNIQIRNQVKSLGHLSKRSDNSLDSYIDMSVYQRKNAIDRKLCMDML
jgi:hypothetical protein